MRPRTFAAAALTACALGACAAPDARADGFIVIERPPRPEPRRVPGPFPLAVERHLVDVSIDGQVATTEIDQTFRNPLDQRLEGTYMFPLPADAAVDSFSMWIDGEEMKGELLDSGKALKIYTDIVRSMRDPALLEYAGRGMFKVRIFPIEPKSTKRVRLTYRQVLEADAGRCRYRYPLNTEKFSSAPLKQAAIRVAISSETAIKGVYSPWHTVDIRRPGEREALASWEASDVTPNRDFVLDFDLAEGDVGMSLRTHAVPAGDGTFLLLIAPKAEVAPGELAAKDVVFVFDTSGSMAADGKLEQARRALQYMIARLAPTDRFGVVDFATDARAYKNALVAATDEEKAGAAHYVKQLVARGGTAIDDALGRGLGYREPGGERPFVVVFLTDGQPTIGEVEPDRILENAQAAAEGKGARVFAWGVGDDLNARLLDRVAQDHRGDSYYVLPGEDIEVAMSSFYDKIASPVLTDLRLSFTGVRVQDVYPRALPDLFRGGQLVVTGRFSGEGHGAIRLTGTVGGEARELVWEGDFRREPENPHVPRLWAERKIAFLLDQIRLHGEDAELKGEVVALARRYGIPTPYTSYLVLEEGELARRGRPGGGEPADEAAPAEAAAETALRRLEREAGGGGAESDGFARAPAASGAGDDAVREAKQAGRLRRGDRADLGDVLGGQQAAVERSIKTVADRTFYRGDGDVWVESTVGERDESWERVEYLSDAYFALLDAQPELGAYLALGKVIFRAGDVVYEVV